MVINVNFHDLYAPKGISRLLPKIVISSAIEKEIILCVATQNI